MSFRLVAFHYPKPEHHDEMIRRITRAAEVMTTVPGCLEADCWKEESSKCRGGHRDVRIQRSLHTRLRSCCRRQRRYRLRRPRVRPQRRLQPDRDELRHGRHRAHLCPEGFKTLIHAGNHSFPGGTVVLEPQGVLSSSCVCARSQRRERPVSTRPTQRNIWPTKRNGAVIALMAQGYYSPSPTTPAPAVPNHSRARGTPPACRRKHERTVAQTLTISADTVQTHIRNAMKKLGPDAPRPPRPRQALIR